MAISKYNIFGNGFVSDSIWLSAPTLLGLGVTLYIVHCFIQHTRLSHFKGPPTVGFSKLWLLYVIRSGNMHQAFTEVNRKYGTFLRFFRPVYQNVIIG